MDRMNAVSDVFFMVSGKLLFFGNLGCAGGFNLLPLIRARGKVLSEPEKQKFATPPKRGSIGLTEVVLVILQGGELLLCTDVARAKGFTVTGELHSLKRSVHPLAVLVVLCP